MTTAVLLCALFPQMTAVPAGDAILRRVEAAQASVEDYTVTLEITADLEQARIPQMKATMYFKKPDRVHFESEGFALLPKEAFTLRPTLLLERFRVDSVVAEIDGGQREYRLLLVARDERARVRDLWLQVSPERWTIDGGELNFAEGRRIAVQFRHERLGSVWLPSEMSLSFSQSGAAIAEPPPSDDQNPVRLGRGSFRRGTVTVRYSGYRLNTGLPDDLFLPSSVPSRR